jgi:hypothetical protein
MVRKRKRGRVVKAVPPELALPTPVSPLVAIGMADHLGKFMALPSRIRTAGELVHEADVGDVSVSGTRNALKLAKALLEQAARDVDKRLATLEEKLERAVNEKLTSVETTATNDAARQNSKAKAKPLRGSKGKRGRGREPF